MDRALGNSEPGFLEGTEVARARPRVQPGFDEQLQLLKSDADLKKKLGVAVLVILGVFVCGIMLGALLGIFV